MTDDDDEEMNETDSFDAALQIADLVISNIRTNKQKVPTSSTSLQMQYSIFFKYYYLFILI